MTDLFLLNLLFGMIAGFIFGYPLYDRWMKHTFRYANEFDELKRRWAYAIILDE